MLRRSEAAADILRLSVGRVARGLDVDIQHELRERMHLLEPEMTEGYVGRRILGSDVEIAFISAWEREPRRPLARRARVAGHLGQLRRVRGGDVPARRERGRRALTVRQVAEERLRVGEEVPRQPDVVEVLVRDLRDRARRRTTG